MKQEPPPQMRATATDLPGVILIQPEVYGDDRGFFFETYNRDSFRDMGIHMTFAQANHSRSARGVIRGLHYQLRRPQAKLVRVIEGEIYDVVLDIRRGSPTFGQWVSTVLSAREKNMLFIPEGFAHGFCACSEVAEMIYFCSDVYCPEEERGILWSDPELAIPWPLHDQAPLLSDRDQAFGPLASQPVHELPVFDSEAM